MYNMYVIEEMETTEIISCVRGYHVYKNIWEPAVGEIFHANDILNTTLCQWWKMGKQLLIFQGNFLTCVLCFWDEVEPHSVLWEEEDGVQQIYLKAVWKFHAVYCSLVIMKIYENSYNCFLELHYCEYKSYD